MPQPCEAIPSPEAIAAERKVRARAIRWKLLCLAIVAASFVLNPDHPTGRWTLCPMMATTHLPCPGCGITRAMTQFGHGHFVRSLYYHPLGPVVWVGVLVYGSTLVWPGALLRPARRTWQHIRQPMQVIVYVLIALLFAFGLLRLIFIYTARPAWWVW